MTCPVDSEQLDSYLDKECEPKFAEWFDSHRRECSLCRQRFELQRHLKGVVRQCVSLEVTPEFTRSRVLRALEEAAGVKTPALQARSEVPVLVASARGPAARRSVNWWRPALAAAGLLLVGTTAFVRLNHATTNHREYALGAAMENDHNRCFSIKAPTTFGGIAANPVPGMCTKAGYHEVPEVAQFPPLTQCNVRMCPIDGHPAWHTMYNDAQNNTVSVFTLPETQGLGQNLPEAANTIEPAMFSAQQHNLAAWKHKGWVYSMVANMPQDELANLAEQGTYPPQQQARAAFVSMDDDAVPQGYALPGQPQFGNADQTGFGAPVQPALYTPR